MFAEFGGDDGGAFVRFANSGREVGTIGCHDEDVGGEV